MQKKKLSLWCLILMILWKLLIFSILFAYARQNIRLIFKKLKVKLFEKKKL